MDRCTKSCFFLAQSNKIKQILFNDLHFMITFLVNSRGGKSMGGTKKRKRKEREGGGGEGGSLDE